MSAKTQLAVLLATTTALATTAGAAPLLTHDAGVRHHGFPTSGLSVLYDQIDNDTGTGIVSQNFEATFDAYDCEAADDFIVPDGVKWKVKEIDIVGTTFDGSGKASSENVLFYKDRHGVPGKLKAQFQAVVGRQQFGNFIVRLAPAAMLKPGHYWVSFQVNESFNQEGEWAWETREDQVNAPSVWRNPGDGFDTGCSDWTTETECIPQGGDHLFALRGQALPL